MLARAVITTLSEIEGKISLYLINTDPVKRIQSDHPTQSDQVILICTLHVESERDLQNWADTAIQTLEEKDLQPIDFTFSMVKHDLQKVEW